MLIGKPIAGRSIALTRKLMPNPTKVLRIASIRDSILIVASSNLSFDKIKNPEGFLQLGLILVQVVSIVNSFRGLL
jgi:hypothetical protein